MATADDYGLSEMREEHGPVREIDGEVCRLVKHDCWWWVGPDHPEPSLPRWHECHPDDAHQSIDAARRKALKAAGWIIQEHFSRDVRGGLLPESPIVLEFAADYPDGRYHTYPDLHAAYAAVFEKESPHAQV